MKLNFLVATSQVNSEEGRSFGTGNVRGLRHLAEIMNECKIRGDLYVLPFGSRNADIASPFSLNNGFALTADEINFFDIPELRENPQLKANLEEIHTANSQFFQQNRTVSYTLKRTLVPWVINGCYSVFKETGSIKRQKAFQEFQGLASYWLEDFALFELYKEIRIDLQDERFRDKNSRQVKEISDKYKNRIEYFKYYQFLCFEQRQQIHHELKELNVGLILNLPFGVELECADVFFHPEVFEKDYQVGCSPEPEHGYPEQAWGVAVYKEKSRGLEQYLTEKMNWLSLMGDGVFLDHFVGWCGQYVVPLFIPSDSTYPHGHFLTEDHEERKSNVSWFIDIVKQSGLEIRGEVAGDSARVEATSEVIEEYIRKGENISAMSIPRWESRQNILIPLNRYQASTLMMVETHDTSTLLQYLINQKGYEDDFETAERILEFCNRVLALPFFLDDVPLQLPGCDDSFWVEICQRLCQGSPSRDIVFTLPGLLSILSEEYRSPTVENNINIKPGTSGRVGNGWRNWSYYSPPIETMVQNPRLKETLETLGNRQYLPFDYFHQFTEVKDEINDLEIIYSKPANRSIIYRNHHSVWTHLELPPGLAPDKIDLELVINNSGNEEVWQRINLSRLIDLEEFYVYNFQDLNLKRECYSYSSEDLATNLFFVRMQPGQIHHFLVYKDREKIPLSFND
ncbi:4-alpha-glucanotransferase [bacterium]|nr:4-alpha-glucanotransferase [bacterium]